MSQMDIIIKVNVAGDVKSELIRAVENVDDVDVVSRQDGVVRLQGDQEGFDALDYQLKRQVSEEEEYEQYEYAKANENARTRVNAALHERKQTRNE